MSRQGVEPVRQPLSLRADSQRDRVDTLVARFPRATARLLRASWLVQRRLSPASRVRRASLRLFAERAIAAINRGDLELFSVVVHPEIDSVNTADLVALGGFAPEVHGREAWLEGQRRWLDEWDELRYEPSEVIDVGDGRLLFLGRGRGTGRASGITLDTEWGLVATVRDGLLAREENFLDRAEARAAAGLPAS